MGDNIDEDVILEFIEAGHDVVVAASSQLSEPMRYRFRPLGMSHYALRIHTDIVTSCHHRALCEKIGVDMEGKGTAVVDHVDHVLGGTGHTSVLADGFSGSKAILGGFKSRVSCPTIVSLSYLPLMHKNGR